MYSQLHVLREDGAQARYVDCYGVDYRKRDCQLGLEWRLFG
jgi:hypothetical protein